MGNEKIPQFRDLLDKRFPKGIDEHIGNVILDLLHSVIKSANSGDDRGDFAKGREQMGMHAIALLLGSDWKTIEQIIFGESNGD